MRVRLLVCICVVGLMTVAGWAGQSAKGTDEIRALVPKIVSAWETLDIAKVDPYYAKDADLAYFDLAPMKYANWAEYRVGVQKAFFDTAQSLKFKINPDLAVHRSGNLAWTTFTFSGDLASKQGGTTHVDGRWTMILESRGGKWLVVHEHVSVPMGGS